MLKHRGSAGLRAVTGHATSGDRKGRLGNASERTQRAAIENIFGPKNDELRLEEKGLRFRGNDGSHKCPTFTDPDGNWFQLVDPSDH